MDRSSVRVSFSCDIRPVKNNRTNGDFARLGRRYRFRCRRVTSILPRKNCATRAYCTVGRNDIFFFFIAIAGRAKRGRNELTSAKTGGFHASDVLRLCPRLRHVSKSASNFHGNSASVFTGSGSDDERRDRPCTRVSHRRRMIYRRKPETFRNARTARTNNAYEYAVNR